MKEPHQRASSSSDSWCAGMIQQMQQHCPACNGEGSSIKPKDRWAHISSNGTPLPSSFLSQCVRDLVICALRLSFIFHVCFCISLFARESVSFRSYVCGACVHVRLKIRLGRSGFLYPFRTGVRNALSVFLCVRVLN